MQKIKQLFSFSHIYVKPAFWICPFAAHGWNLRQISYFWSLAESWAVLLWELKRPVQSELLSTWRESSPSGWAAESSASWKGFFSYLLLQGWAPGMRLGKGSLQQQAQSWTMAGSCLFVWQVFLKAAPRILCRACCLSRSWKLPVLLSAREVSAVSLTLTFSFGPFALPLKSPVVWFPFKTTRASSSSDSHGPRWSSHIFACPLWLGRLGHSYSLSPMGISWQKADASPQTLGAHIKFSEWVSSRVSHLPWDEGLHSSPLGRWHGIQLTNKALRGIFSHCSTTLTVRC